MKFKLIITSALILSVPNILHCEESNGLGIGVGSQYNGIGVSYGYQSRTSFKYASLGCLEISSSDISGTYTNCGFGAGFISTNLMDSTNNKHGTGVHLGFSDNERYGEVEYFIAPQYVFYMNGINNHGWTFGASLRIGTYDGESDVIPTVHAGYQF